MPSSTRKWIADQVAALGLALGDEVSTQRLLVYVEDLSDISQEHLAIAFQKARKEYEYPKLPPVAFIRRMAGAHAQADGRPGPEEAWAMCPKTEDASVVWTDEMAAAFAVARSLLADGDSIAARMTFRELYAAAVERARTDQRPVHWSPSLGWDKSCHVQVLAEAVTKHRLTAAHALSLVSGESRDQLLTSLPESEHGRLLTGETDGSRAQLTGIHSVLEKMAEAKQLSPEVQVRRNLPPPEHSPEEWRELREKAKSQLELVKRSRNRSGHGIGDVI